MRVSGASSEQEAQSSRRRVLAYHEFSYAPSRDVYQLGPDLFREQLNGAVAAGQKKAAELEITFDDAHQSQVDIAAPALEELGLYGLFFVPSAFVGNRRETTTWSELRSLAAAGHRVGSHGETHCFFTRVAPDVLARELSRSKSVLEDRLGVAVTTLSAPGGRWNSAVAAASELAGYQRLYTSDPGYMPGRNVSAPGTMLEVIGRLVVRRTMSIRTVAGYIAGDGLIAARLWAEYRAKKTVKRLVGDGRYQAVWARYLRQPVEGGL